MTERWKVGEGYASFFVQDSRGHTIFQTPSNELAEQIVREHNTHEGLVELAAKGLYVDEILPYTREQWEDRSEETRQYWRDQALANIDGDNTH